MSGPLGTLDNAKNINKNKYMFTTSNHVSQVSIQACLTLPDIFLAGQSGHSTPLPAFAARGIFFMPNLRVASEPGPSMNAQTDFSTFHGVETAPWFALRSITGKEREAAADVASTGATPWLPSYRTLTKPTKKRKPVEVRRFLMPGYVLAQVEPHQWPALATTRHVIGWVADTEGAPLPCLPRREGPKGAVRVIDEIDRIRREVAIGLHDNEALEGQIAPGTVLDVLFGLFANRRIKFIATRGTVIEGEIEILGAPRRVRIPAHNVDLSR